MTTYSTTQAITYRSAKVSGRTASYFEGTLTVFQDGRILREVELDFDPTEAPGRMWVLIDADVEVEEAAETVNGFEVETVNVSELREGDQVVHEGSTESWFVNVTTAPFRASFYNGNTGQTTLDSSIQLTLGGSRKRVGLEQTYRRAVDSEAVKAAQWAEQRALSARLRRR